MQTMTRRQLLGSLGAMAPALAIARAGGYAQAPQPIDAGPLPASALPLGIRARLVNNVNGIRMHVLEAGYDGARRPAVLLVHGFPELAYSWRKVMLPIAAAGYHVI